MTSYFQIPVIGILFSIVIEFVLYIFLFFQCSPLWLISVIIAYLPWMNMLYLFITKLMIKSHILSKINGLKQIYSSRLATIKKELRMSGVNIENHQDITRINKLIQDCELISNRINAQNLVNFTFDFLRLIILSSGLFKGFLEIHNLLVKLQEDPSIKNLRTISSKALLFFISFCILVSIIIFPFIYKRLLFIQRNVYTLENAKNGLFTLIKISEFSNDIENNFYVDFFIYKEFPLDFFIYLINYLCQAVLNYSFLTASLLYLGMTEVIYRPEDILPTILIVIFITLVNFLILFKARKLR